MSVLLAVQLRSGLPVSSMCWMRCLGLGVLQQFDEERRSTVSSHSSSTSAAGLDLATAQGNAAQPWRPVVVRRDHAALLHVDQHHLQVAMPVRPATLITPRAVAAGA
jgi:hypothetical protein